MTLDDNEDDVRIRVEQGHTATQIAASLGVPRSTLLDFLDRKGIPRPGRKSRQVKRTEPDFEVGAVSQEELLADENRRLKAAMRSNRKADVAHERVMLAIEDALASAPFTVAAPYHPEAHPDNPGAKHRQAVILSDWHAGEVVDSAQVGGLNEFDWDVLERRVDGVASALLSFKQVRPELTGLDLWVLGDMVSGDIHEELTATNQYPVAEQAVKTGKLLGEFIARLAPHYPDLHVSAIAGNHARTKKPHASKNVFDSWDWTAYQLAQGITATLPNVTWDIPRAGTLVREIAGLKFLLFHGDGIRSSMPGVPAGGVTRRTNELRKQYAQQGIHLDGFACGHFHSANMWAGNVFINGSLIGTNEFGLKNFGGGEAPKQLLLTFDERKGRITDVGFITPR